MIDNVNGAPYTFKIFNVPITSMSLKNRIYYIIVQVSGLLNIRAYLNQSTGERHLIVGNDRLTESVIVDGRIPRFDDFGVILESLQLTTYRKTNLLRKSKQGNFFCFAFVLFNLPIR